MVLTIVRIWGKDKNRIGWVPGGIAVAVGKCVRLLLLSIMIVSQHCRYVQCPFFHTCTYSGRYDELVLEYLSAERRDAGHCSSEWVDLGRRRDEHCEFNPNEYRRSTSMMETLFSNLPIYMKPYVKSCSVRGMLAV